MKSAFLLFFILTTSFIPALVRTNSLAGQTVTGTIGGLQSNRLRMTQSALCVENTPAESLSQHKQLFYKRTPRLALPHDEGQRALSAACQTSGEQEVMKSVDSSPNALFLSNPIGTEKLIREFLP